MSNLSIRLWFCVAVAFVALAFADPLTEWASNAGLFGSGNFTDHSNADAVPALLVGFACMASHLIARCRSVRRESDPQAWLSAWARVLDARALTHLLPLIYALQIGALYVTETFEQHLVLGHGLGGSIWLGAPIVASLLIHALFCAATAFAIARVVRTFARTALRIARSIAVIALRRPRESGLALRRLCYFPSPFDSAPLVCRIGERAPPFAVA